MAWNKPFRFFIGVVGIVTLLVTSVFAAEYPARDIRVIQPYPAGGFNDMVTRKMADVIAKNQLLPREIIPVAITGANTRNALQAVLDADPDGHTLLMHHTALVATKASGQLPIGYQDFEMLGGLGRGPIAIDVAKDSPWKTVQDMIAAIRKHPGKYTMAIPGTGGTSHIAMLHFLKMAGIPLKDIRIMPLSGGSETLKAIMGGKVDVRCATAADTMRATLSGEVRPLVVLSHQQLPAFKGVTNLKDLGMDDSLHISIGLFAPKGTPQAVKDAWARILEKVAADEAFRAFMDERGSPAKYTPPAEWARSYEADTKLANDIMRAAKQK